MRLRRYRWTTVLLVWLLVFFGAAATGRAMDGVVRIVYFTSSECGHCQAVFDDLLEPLQRQHGSRLQIKVVDISDPDEPGGIDADHYELLAQAEKLYSVDADEQALPMILVGGEVLIGEDTIRDQLPCLVDNCLGAGGTEWPQIPGLSDVADGLDTGSVGIGIEPLGGSVAACESDEVAACEAPAAIWMAYFYEVGCQECSRVEYDIRYLRSQYPQLMIEEYNVQSDAALAEWLGTRLSLPEDQRLATPALFVGNDSLIGEEITHERLQALVEKYAGPGAERVWSDFDPERAEDAILARFRSFGVLTVAFAGLVDGLNPCAFATLCFFVSYLALSGRKGREVLAVGAAFTLGVFLAYLVVGLGFYRVLDLLGDWLTTLGRWVYGATGLFCVVLAVISFRDFLKARRGNVGDMALNLPHALRMRINSVIRRGRGARAFVVSAFITGVVVSFLELACTGQVYLPTIVFVASQPDMRARAIVLLVLYNLLFIAPLVVVFFLTYYGTSSKHLTRFLQERAATVKLGMALLFAGLATWLIVSVVVV
jgi:cytochrome c biogenesis protein CcdA